MSKSGVEDRWPGPDDRLVVAVMLADTSSSHWNECLNFVEMIIKLSNLPASSKEEAVQKAMMVVFRSLKEFRYECRFRTWLRIIVYTRVVDDHRYRARNQRLAHTHDPPEALEYVADYSGLEITSPSSTPEEICLLQEALREVLAELQVYADAHRHPERDRFILQKVLLDGHSREDVARELGISAAMVGYVVRSAQQHLRDQGLGP
jgi:RNA polymerase sigma factor (sigma-70 family)